MKFSFFPTESDCLQSAKREENTNATISYPVLPPDQSVEESGSSMSPYPNEHPPSSSHSSTPSQPSNEAHGAGMTSMPNTPAGSTAVPTTVTHTQPYHVAPGADPLSSPGTAGQPAFTRRWVPLPIHMFLSVVCCCFFTVFSRMLLSYHWELLCML